MDICFDPTARKKPTNLSVNSDLLRQAKELGINMSQVFEERLAEVIREKKRLKWLEENRVGLEAYGRFLEENGLFSDSTRRF
jgi:antitoxin CcdA